MLVELSINEGDYCPCGPVDPYRRSHLRYLGIGCGYSMPIWKWLHLDLSFVSYQILNSVSFKSHFPQYIIGLNVDLGRGHQEAIKLDEEHANHRGLP